MFRAGFFMLRWRTLWSF